MVVRPFPFAQLPRVGAAEAARARAVLRRLLPTARTPRPALPTTTTGSWRALLGGDATACPLSPALVPLATVRARYEGRALACVLDHRTLGPLAALLDAPLGHALAARALGADEADALRVAAARTYLPAHEGALALLCAQAAVLACAPSPPPTVRAVTEHVPDALEALGAPAELLVWPWRVAVGALAGEVALLVPPALLLRAPEPGADLAGRLADAAVTGELVAAHESLAARELAGLVDGDVLLLENGGLALADSGALTGAMVLALGGTWVPVGCAHDRRITIAGEARAKGSTKVATDENTPGSGGGASAVRTEVLGTLPVEVEVVLARAAFTVGEIAAWRVGEVISLAAPVGEPVLLRAGGRPVARGELCDVDGAVGVRVTEML